MRPLAQEILAHLPSETKRPAAAPPPPTNDDAELEAVLASLKTNIKVVGCGGSVKTLPVFGMIGLSVPSSK